VLDNLQEILKQGDNLTLFLLILSALVVVLMLGWLTLGLRLRRLNRQLSALTRGVEGRNLEETLVAHLETVTETTRRMEALEQAVGILQAQLPHCLQRTGLVRYDAFESVGGEQSFSVALLDAQGDGVVLSGVHSRTDVRIYAKAIREGKVTHELSEEEKRALKESWN
jgi:hypothetical protein